MSALMLAGRVVMAARVPHPLTYLSELCCQHLERQCEPPLFLQLVSRWVQ